MAAIRKKTGYGVFNSPYSKSDNAHRFSWRLRNGVIPDGLFVLHRCDNPPCVNPDHLFLGTQRDNMIDKVAKGRQARGRAQNGTTLTEVDVLAIRADTRRHREIAACYGISRPSVSAIKSRRNWRHV
jgi:hypothetical protein